MDDNTNLRPAERVDDPANSTSECATRGTALRSQRIADYLNASLTTSDALQANLGVVSTDLLVIAFHLKQVIEEALQEGPGALEEHEHLGPAIDQYLRIAKQFDRFAQLTVKLEGRAEAKAAKLAAFRSSTDSTASEDSGF